MDPGAQRDDITSRRDTADAFMVNQTETTLFSYLNEQGRTIDHIGSRSEVLIDYFYKIINSLSNNAMSLTLIIKCCLEDVFETHS